MARQVLHFCQGNTLCWHGDFILTPGRHAVVDPPRKFGYAVVGMILRLILRCCKVVPCCEVSARGSFRHGHHYRNFGLGCHTAVRTTAISAQALSHYREGAGPEVCLGFLSCSGCSGCPVGSTAQARRFPALHYLSPVSLRTHVERIWQQVGLPFRLGTHIIRHRGVVRCKCAAGP